MGGGWAEGFFENRDEDFVAAAVEVDAVFTVKGGIGFMVGGGEGEADVDEVEVLVGGGEITDEGVGLVNNAGDFFAGGAGCDGDEVDGGVGEFGVDVGDEGLKVVEDFLGGGTIDDVVAAAVDDDGFGFVGEDGAGGVGDEVGEGGTAEGAIEGVEIFDIGEVLGEGFPEGEGGGTDEEGGVGGRGVGAVRFFEGGDGFFEAVGGGGGSGA